MSKNSHAVDTQKKHKSKDGHQWLTAFVVRAVGFYIAVLIVLRAAVQFFAYSHAVAAYTGLSDLLANRVMFWLGTWWELWFFVSLLRIKVPILRQSFISVIVTMVSWELSVLVLLRIFNQTLLALPYGLGVAALLIPGLLVGTVSIARLFHISKKQSFILTVLCVLCYPLLFASFVFFSDVLNPV